MKLISLTILVALFTSQAHAMDKAEAIVTCQSAVEQQAKIPKSVDFDHWSTRCANSGGTWSCVGEVEMSNAFGTLLPHLWACQISERGIEEIAVIAR